MTTMRQPRSRSRAVEMEIVDTAEFMNHSYARVVDVSASHDVVVGEIRRLLDEEGMHILSDISLDQELGRIMKEDMRPFTLLGAWSPALAHRAMQAEPQTVLLLPLNIGVLQLEADRVRVWIPDAEALYAQTSDGEVESVARETQVHLNRVLGYLREMG